MPRHVVVVRDERLRKEVATVAEPGRDEVQGVGSCGIHRGIERLTGDTSVRRVLDLDVPTISLPVMPGRNLAVLTEAAARTHILRSKGVDPAAAFMARHSHFLERGTP